MEAWAWSRTGLGNAVSVVTVNHGLSLASDGPTPGVRPFHMVECLVRRPALGYDAGGTDTRLECRLAGGPDSRDRGATEVVASDVPSVSGRLPWVVSTAS